MFKKNRSSAVLDTAIAMKATRKAAVVGRTVRGLGDLSDQTVVVGGGLGLDLCPDHDPGRGRDPPVVEKGGTTNTWSSWSPVIKRKIKKMWRIPSHIQPRQTHSDRGIA